MNSFIQFIQEKRKEILYGVGLLLLMVLLLPQSRRVIFNVFQFYIIDAFHSSEDTEFFFKKGVNYSEKNNLNLALKTFKKNVKNFNPTDPYQKESLYNLGVLYYQAGEKLLKKQRKKAMTYFKKADILWSQYLKFYPEDTAKKNQIINARVYIDSLDEKPINQMAQYYKNQGQQAYYNKEYDKAIEFYQKAIKADPTYDTVYNNIGSVYFYKKDYENAVKYWEQAVLLNPKGNEDLYLTMGGVYGQFLHNPERAIYFLQKYLDLHPKDSQKQNIEQTILYMKKQIGQTNE